jgi:two-component system response regulator GlrR
MVRLRASIAAAVESALPILIEGEPGLGQDATARLVHALSDRSGRRFIAFDCSELPAPVLESELFGHVRGSFAGAVRDRVGAIAAADGGTLLLTDVGRLPRGVQEKLARFLETGTMRVIGADKTAAVDVRVISIASGDLAWQVASGAFRRDLYNRLAAVRIVVPALRTRAPEILPMLRRFLSEFSATHHPRLPGTTPPAESPLLAAAWVDFIEELRQLADALVITPSGRVADPSGRVADPSGVVSGEAKAQGAQGGPLRVRGTGPARGEPKRTGTS